MTRWSELAKTHSDARDQRRKDWCNALIVEVKRAIVKNICSPFEQYRIKQEHRMILVRPGRGGVTVKTKKNEVPAIALCNLPALDDAKLAFQVLLHPDQRRIEQYTMSVEGTERVSGRPWYARIDLDPEQRGSGPCSHGMLHAHVGMDPAEKDGQEARVPLPWLDPDEALAWIFATLDGSLEPP